MSDPAERARPSTADARETVDRASPPARPVRRVRRFALPTEQHDDARTSERIEAFLEGPPKPRRRGSKVAQRRPHRVPPLDTRADWNSALRLEEARAARYARPVSVMVVAFGASAPTNGGDQIARPIGDAIRFAARETDRVARVGPDRFHVLLPETTGGEASHLAERLATACRERVNGAGADVALRIETASSIHGESIVEALAECERRLAT
ncbi:MAG: diguanylate cyclase domain-containing protein [Chloroflexota bacterium]